MIYLQYRKYSMSIKKIEIEITDKFKKQEQNIIYDISFHKEELIKNNNNLDTLNTLNILPVNNILERMKKVRSDIEGEYAGFIKDNYEFEMLRLRFKKKRGWNEDQWNILSNLPDDELIKWKDGQIENWKRQASFWIEYHNKIINDLELLFENNIWEKSNEKPVLFQYSISSFSPDDYKNNQYLYQGCIYTIDGPFSNEEKELLIMEKFDQERKKFERLKYKHKDFIDIKYKRPNIPESVRIIVWKRDGGKCSKCGSRENLEYDHIIPISKGGNNTARNIELLCEKCNRAKGAKIE